ncbi:pyridoxamine 5'-phosphate oxidase family protein [Hamadaea tsunoensis]|uniref:pyridoxamine 5'-phosphate oxidase family protein n=1 Tax=Hamadaea tsunoensis TaxID=53368 RepID=UPI000425F312|nr:pyridoxamine 5'-phosphate oxidase family protein [Hamadaea tsunoensis]
MLTWTWALERLRSSHAYWLATTRPDGGPHVMPVWAMWHDGALWFSCSLGSRKTRNLLAEPRCVLTTENPREPVVVEGRAEQVTDLATLRTVLDVENAKYGTAYGMDMLDPAANACFRVRPATAFGLIEAEFTTSPTRWTFDA